MSEKIDLPINLKPIKSTDDLKRGDVFLWKSGQHGHFEIHTFKFDRGYGAQTFTESDGEGSGEMIVNYSGICGVIETIN
jgi:hypothetical protein